MLGAEVVNFFGDKPLEWPLATDKGPECLNFIGGDWVPDADELDAEDSFVL